ncbi:hypothetical protein ACWCQV_24805, partial [Streptomyces eurythermus]
MIRAALADVRSSGMRIVPVFPFVAAWPSQHDDYEALTDPVPPEVLQRLDAELHHTPGRSWAGIPEPVPHDRPSVHGRALTCLDAPRPEAGRKPAEPTGGSAPVDAARRPGTAGAAGYELSGRSGAGGADGFLDQFGDAL